MRVLIVEDEQALREGLTDLLSAAGHEVVAYEYGKEAVTAGTEQAFDLVLLDLMLPDLDGVEVCRRLRRARPGTPMRRWRTSFGTLFRWTAISTLAAPRRSLTPRATLNSS